MKMRLDEDVLRAGSFEPALSFNKLLTTCKSTDTNILND
jgi:hypothetical protein